MKKISKLLFSALIAGLVFTSCTKDEEEGNGTVDMNLIQGKWNFNKSGYNGKLSFSVDYAGNVEGCQKDYILIESAGVVKSGDYQEACVFEETTGSWTQDGNNVSVVVEGSAASGTFEVTTLNETELVLKQKNEEGATLSQSFTRGN